MQTITLNIDGMTCGGCVKSVTRLLEGVEGVEKADESKTDTDALIDAVEDGGYDVAL